MNNPTPKNRKNIKEVLEKTTGLRQSQPEMKKKKEFINKYMKGDGVIEKI